MITRFDAISSVVWFSIYSMIVLWTSSSPFAKVESFSLPVFQLLSPHAFHAIGSFGMISLTLAALFQQTGTSPRHHSNFLVRFICVHPLIITIGIGLSAIGVFIALTIYQLFNCEWRAAAVYSGLAIYLTSMVWSIVYFESNFLGEPTPRDSQSIFNTSVKKGALLAIVIWSGLVALLHIVKHMISQWV